METFRIQDLPVELERSIFEIAARSDHRAALNLVVVSRQTKEWIQPLIYEMVTLGSNDLRKFLRTMDMLPATFLAQNVKILCLTISIRSSDAQKILQTCTGVSSLAFWIDLLHSNAGPSPLLSQLLRPLPLRRLSIEAKHFHAIILSECPWTSSLTYLDLVYWEPGSVLISELQLLPSLTHLALRLQHMEVDDSAIAYIFSAAPSLLVLCLVIDEAEFENFEHRTWSDPRVACVSHPESVPDWEAPYRGLRDLWDAADDIVAEQQKMKE